MQCDESIEKFKRYRLARHVQDGLVEIYNKIAQDIKNGNITEENDKKAAEDALDKSKGHLNSERIKELGSNKKFKTFDRELVKY